MKIILAAFFSFILTATLANTCYANSEAGEQIVHQAELDIDRSQEIIAQIEKKAEVDRKNNGYSTDQGRRYREQIAEEHKKIFEAKEKIASARKIK